jgi:hypothetical protein
VHAPHKLDELRGPEGTGKPLPPQGWFGPRSKVARKGNTKALGAAGSPHFLCSDVAMTIREEIEAAMRNGASAMFVMGLLVCFKDDPDGTLAAFEAAAETVRVERDVKLSAAETNFQSKVPRLKSRL